LQFTINLNIHVHPRLQSPTAGQQRIPLHFKEVLGTHLSSIAQENFSVLLVLKRLKKILVDFTLLAVKLDSKSANSLQLSALKVQNEPNSFSAPGPFWGLATLPDTLLSLWRGYRVFVLHLLASTRQATRNLNFWQQCTVQTRL